MALMPDPTAAAATPMGGGQTLNDRARREALVMALMRQGQPNAAASSRSPMGSIAGGVGQGVDAFTRERGEIRARDLTETFGRARADYHIERMLREGKIVPVDPDLPTNSTRWPSRSSSSSSPSCRSWSRCSSTRRTRPPPTCGP